MVEKVWCGRYQPAYGQDAKFTSGLLGKGVISPAQCWMLLKGGRMAEIIFHHGYWNTSTPAHCNGVLYKMAQYKVSPRGVSAYTLKG